MRFDLNGQPIATLDKAVRPGTAALRLAADKPRIESRDDRLAVRRFPTFATISRHLRVQAQVLNNDVLKSLVARARRRVGLHNNDCANLQSVELAAAPAR